MNPRRLRDIPDRAERAGVTITVCDDKSLGANAPYDVVLCDVPCSGSGTWRRTPDAKWKFAQDDLSKLLAAQSDVLESAIQLVGKGGIIVYTTCSVLPEENDRQIDSFLERHPGWHKGVTQSWLPDLAGDGFFLSMLSEKQL